MTLDLIVLVFVLLFAVLGLWTGAAKQLGHWVGLAAAWFSARPLAALAGPKLAAPFGLPEFATTLVCGVVIFIVVYAVIARLVRSALGAIFPEGEKGALNRLGGMALGAAKAAVVCYLLLAILALFEQPLTRAVPGIRAQADSSIALGLVRRHNALAPVFESARARAAREAHSRTAAAVGSPGSGSSALGGSGGPGALPPEALDAAKALEALVPGGAGSRLPDPNLPAD